jgi:hypothetical protein
MLMKIGASVPVHVGQGQVSEMTKDSTSYTIPNSPRPNSAPNLSSKKEKKTITVVEPWKMEREREA